MTDTTIKLQAFLAHAGISSRRKAETLIAEGLVTVNGEVAHIGQRVTAQDHIEYQGKDISEPAVHTYVLINKPLNLVSTVNDELGRHTVMTLLPKSLRDTRLYPVGRLDQDSQGLMLLTNDGEVAYRLTHPKFLVPKTYEVVLNRKPTGKALDYLKRGVRLTDGIAYCHDLKNLGDNRYQLSITDGRNRQVRRMWQRVGYEVHELIRVSFGPFTLDDLGENPYLELGAEEIRKLKTSLKLLK